MKYLFLHIPKTAGTSLRKALLTRFEERDVAQVYDGDEVQDKLKKALAQEKPLIYGHVDFGHLQKVRYEHYRLLVFFRHPVERCISTYIHFLHDDRAGRTKEGRKFEGFEDFMHSPFGNNWMCQYLSGEKNSPAQIADPELLLEKALLNFQKLDWVGVTERYSDSLIALGHFMNISLPRLKENSARDKQLKQQLKEDFAEEILQRNQADLKLWKLANQRLDEELRQVPFLFVKRIGNWFRRFLKV